MDRFPKSLIEFQERFPDEASCAAYLYSLRWPKGFVCPACGADRAWSLKSKADTFQCAACYRQTSVTAGTIMHASKLPLRTWFLAAFLMATHSNGISALQLQSMLGLGSYRTAWMLTGKLRRAMVDPRRHPLAGVVEIDEASLPLRTKDDPPAGGGGRSHEGKMLIVGGIEVNDGKPGRLRLAAIKDYSADSLHAFIKAALAVGSTARTDGWSGYPGAPEVAHDPHVVGPMPPTSSCPGYTSPSPTSRRGPRASTMVCAGRISKHIWMSSFSGSIADIRLTPPSVRFLVLEA